VTSTAAAAAAPTPVGEYTIGLEQLVSMTKNQNFSALQQYVGASLLQCFLFPESVTLYILRNPSALLIYSTAVLFRLKAWQAYSNQFPIKGLVEMKLIYQRGKMHLEPIHILGKGAKVSGYILYYPFLFPIDQSVAVLLLILPACFTEISMGILARSYSYNLDYSSCGVIGTRNKNRGATNTLVF